VKDPGVFVQVAVPPDAQLEVPAVHSLMSAKEGKEGESKSQDSRRDNGDDEKREENSPVQVTPLPEYPVLQAQV